MSTEYHTGAVILVHSLDPETPPITAQLSDDGLWYVIGSEAPAASVEALTDSDHEILEIIHEGVL